jgi:hypothetical protein
VPEASKATIRRSLAAPWVRTLFGLEVMPPV